jgi:WD40 repeat protein
LSDIWILTSEISETRSLDDRKVITAVSDLTLKIWDSSSGQLLSTLHGHEDEIFVLEPHPVSVNILLTAAHDGQIRVWDIATLSCLFQYKNFIEAQVLKLFSIKALLIGHLQVTSHKFG